MEIPLDRKSQINRFRSAEISLDQASRELDRQRDEVILEVRDSLRTLKQRKDQIGLYCYNTDIHLPRNIQLTVMKICLENNRYAGK